MLRGGPVWSSLQRRLALSLRPTSRREHTIFLHEEFALMIEKGQWVVLPYSVAKGLPGLWLSPPGVKVEQGLETSLARRL